MKLNKILVLMGVVTLASVSAQARHYGDAGCGLGTMLFKENGRVTQILAATTNGTSGNQTFGISSGTSNCTDDGHVALNKELPLFVEVNQIALQKDAARGQGATVVSLAQLLGCSDSVQVGSALQKHYDQIFSDQANMSDAIVGAIRTEQASCSAVVI